MSIDEIRELVTSGVDIQLHTHRHGLSQDDPKLVEKEISDNRRALASVKAPLQHFCYPSGIYNPRQWPWLKALGIKSATTCKPGLNYSNTPRYELRRFLDSEDISEIVFEAELCGLLELLRRARALFLK